ncbi:cathelicidin-6-like [Xenopus laevis]|uniref:Cathelicidin-6-like n=2 Tax=Xenopus laevis TaxID=8355 RepID=A0A1L8FQC9_XENLA|nr:cathelicidin-6-like [Xenopus laevis]OCT73792.1 hypothetical protein XELAEV_18032756mg [Xenopus laevis]
METWCHLLLLFGGAVRIHSAPLNGLTFSSPNSETIKKAVNIYNEGRNSSFLFRLLKSDLQNKQVGTPAGSKLHFMIKETICLNTKQQSLEACAYKENGVVKNCTLTSNPKQRDIKVSCDSLTSEKPSLKENLLDDNVKEYKTSPPLQEAAGNLNLLVKPNVSSYGNRQKPTKTHVSSMSCLSCIFDLFGYARK